MTRWLAVTAALLMLGAAGTVRAQEAGMWSGTVDQPGSGSYGMVMELDGQGGGSSD